MNQRIAEEKALDEALNCPLCGYDLRGLPEHRCPECGHAFDPEQLRRAKTERREWFFEHARRHRVRSFLVTSLHALRPIWFWGRVAAAHEIVPMRLLVWAIAWLAITLLTLSAAMATAEGIARIRPATGLPIGAPRVVVISGRLVRATATPPVVATNWPQAVAARYRGFALWSPAVALAAVLAWPILTVLVLQLFGTTLRGAGVHAGHLRRCTLYAFPLMAIPVAVFAACSCFFQLNWVGPLYGGHSFIDIISRPLSQVLSLIQLSQGALWMLVWATIVSTIHLVSAHVRYLRLRHAAAQALLVQTAVWLLISVLIVFGSGRM